MKPFRIFLFALLFASIAFAEGVAQDKSHFLGGRIAFGLGYVWDNEPVKGSFGSAKDGIGESPLANFAGVEIAFGASYMYRLNGFVGFVGEAEFKMSQMRLDDDVYSLPPKDPSGDRTNFLMTIYGFSFPVLVRVVPTSKFYLEAGAQFNLNIDGDISSADDNDDESFGFDVEPFGWSLVLGGGFNIGWNLFLGMRFVFDMTRIEKEEIVEMTKGAAYREASPMKLWSLQIGCTGYFL